LKKIKTYSSIVLVMILMLLMLCGCKDKNETEADLEKKVNTEISYLDSELITIINSLNNIDYIKYKVITKKITKGSESGEDGSSQQSNEKKNTEQTGGTNSNKQESNKSVSNDESSEQNNEGENSDKVFSMKSNNILDGQVNINWTELKSEIENLYTSWTTIVIDLEKIGVSKEKLNEFSKQMDNVAKSIKDENEDLTLRNVILLYKFLPEFLEIYTNDYKEIDILNCKYNLLQCYEYADLEDWGNFEISVKNLKQNFEKVVKRKEEYEGKSVNIDSSVIIIRDIENSIEMKDKEIFFIKYKNLIQEFNIIMYL